MNFDWKFWLIVIAGYTVSLIAIFVFLWSLLRISLQL